VQYDSNRLVDVVPKLLSRGPGSEQLMTKPLATKFRDWKYEDEVRVYTDLETIDPITGFYFKDFDGTLVLREVILGARFAGKVADVTTLAHACGPGVSVIKARLAFQTFRVVRNKRGVV
jgi:hypothetical protein